MKPIFIFLFSLQMCTMNSLIGNDFEDNHESKNEFRIQDLIPDLANPLAVNPAIPEDFVALSPDGKLDPYQWIYWGPKDVLEAYFKDPSTLKVPLIRVIISSNVGQTGPNSFNNLTYEEQIKEFKKQFPNDFESLETHWGSYPVLSFRAKVDDLFAYVAWVGLNERTVGWTLLFNLVYPNEAGHPNKNDNELWENLLHKTTQLEERDFIRMQGQDMQEGYTLFNFAGAKLKMIAEKREEDGKIQVVVIPENSNIEYKYIDMMESHMFTKWKCGEPLVKVASEIIVKNGNVTNNINYVLSVLYKTVKEFSYTKEEGQNSLIFEKICRNKIFNDRL